MASASSDYGYSYSLRKFVENRKLPASVEVAEGTYGDRTGEGMDTGDFSTGEVLTLLRVKKLVHATFDSIYSHRPSKRGLVVIPLYFGGTFRVQPFNGRTYIYRTVTELAQAFPRFAKAEETMKFDSTNIRPGNKIELLRKIEESPGVKRSIQCKILGGETATEFKMPFGADCFFSASDDDTDYLLPQFVHRLPQRVKFSPNWQNGHGIEGLPERCSEEFFLSFMQIVESVQHNDTDGDKNLSLPLDTDINVTPIDTQKFKKIDSIHAIQTSQLPAVVRITSETDEILDKDLRGTIVEIDKVKKTLDKLLAVTDSGRVIIISTTFDGQFKRITRMFDTVQDLWEAHCNGKLNGKVYVQKTVLSPHSECDSIYQSDILEPVNLGNVVFADKEEGEDVVICKLYDEKTPKKTTEIKLPTYTNGCFVEWIKDLERLYTAAELANALLPIRVQLVDGTKQHKNDKNNNFFFNQKITIVSVFKDELTKVTPLSTTKVSPLLVPTRKPIFCYLEDAKDKPSHSNSSLGLALGVDVEVITDEEYQQLKCGSSYESVVLKRPVIPPRHLGFGGQAEKPPTLPIMQVDTRPPSPPLNQCSKPIPSPKLPSNMQQNSFKPPVLPRLPKSKPDHQLQLEYERLSMEFSPSHLTQGYVTPRKLTKDNLQHDSGSDTSGDETNDYEVMPDIVQLNLPTFPKKQFLKSHSVDELYKHRSDIKTPPRQILKSDGNVPIDEEDMPNDYEEIPDNLREIRKHSQKESSVRSSGAQQQSIPNISDYDYKQMCSLLKKLDFKKGHIDEFKKQKIDGQACLKLNFDELEKKYGYLRAIALWAIIEDNREKYF